MPERTDERVRGKMMVFCQEVFSTLLLSRLAIVLRGIIGEPSLLPCTLAALVKQDRNCNICSGSTLNIKYSQCTTRPVERRSRHRYPPRL